MLYEFDINILVWIFGLIFLYAETHYAFKFFPSRLKKREPEVVIDVPHRVEPGHSLPVLVLVKDAHVYPIILRSAKVTLSQKHAPVIEREYFLEKNIDQHFWWKIISIDFAQGLYGDILVDVEFTIECGGEIRSYRNDNYKISTHSPFDVHFARAPLPTLPKWYYGDLHYHSSYTEDQVEFGAPIWPSVQIAKAMGLQFFAVTDHSYDLDDAVDDYLKNDPTHPKWQSLQRDVEKTTRRQKDFVVIAGEEVSVGNAQNRNIHLLVINDKNFYTGSGDSAEKWLRTKPNFSAAEILDQMSLAMLADSTTSQTLAYAAHPKIRPPWLEWLLIRRGVWKKSDYHHSTLTGLQIYNGVSDKGFTSGISRWIDLLLSGRKLTVVAGNDAHGNFARFRQIGIPFLTMREHKNQIFGKGRTCVLVDGDLSKQSLLRALRKGRSIITVGPFAVFSAEHQNMVYEIGDTITSEGVEINIIVKSSPEFGDLKSISLFVGSVLLNRETCEKTIALPKKHYNFEERLSLRHLPERGYLRLECRSGTAHQEFWCLTNPIWIDRNNSSKEEINGRE